MTKLYYKAPTDKQFKELKKESIKIWNTYSDEYGYASGKVARIKEITNVSDNFMYIVAMFDGDNQTKLAQNLSKETREAVRVRLIDGGTSSFLSVF